MSICGSSQLCMLAKEAGAASCNAMVGASQALTVLHRCIHEATTESGRGVLAAADNAR